MFIFLTYEHFYVLLNIHQKHNFLKSGVEKIGREEHNFENVRKGPPSTWFLFRSQLSPPFPSMIPKTPRLESPASNFMHRINRFKNALLLVTYACILIKVIS